MQADLLTKVILPVSLFCIMFGMGISLRPLDFKKIVKSPKVVAIGICAQMLLLPLTAFIIAIALKLPPEIAVGLIIIALAPGGATSNMFTYISKGDVSLSITLTAIVSLIAPFSIPILAGLSMNYFMDSNTAFNLPIVKTIVQLLVITVLPVVLGMFVLSRWEILAKKIEPIIKWLSILFLILIIVLIVLKNYADMTSYFSQAGLATLVLNLIALILGYRLSRLAKLSTFKIQKLVCRNINWQ